jgi:putative DNA primase/helicase
MTDRTYVPSVATHRESAAWAPAGPLTWDDLIDRLPSLRCWVGGTLSGPERSEETVVSRSILTLDEDEPGRAWAVNVDLALGCAHLIHTTKRSTLAAPRYRLVAPLSRDVTPDEYWLIANAVMDAVGWGRDRGGAQAERFMFGPPDGAEVYSVGGEPLDADEWLARAEEDGVPPRRSQRAPTRPAAELDAPPTRREVAKAHALLDKAAWEVEKLADKDTGNAHGGRNQALIQWLPLLYRFVLGECLDEAEVDSRMLAAAQAAPLNDGGPFSEAEYREVRDHAWKYADGDPRRPEVEEDFDQLDPDAWPDVPSRLDDAHLAPWMAQRGLRGLWCWAGGLGWMTWDGRRWVPRADENVREAIRLAVIEVNRAALASSATAAQMKALAGLLSVGRIGALASLMKGVVAVDAGTFDQRPDLLNVGNGVVDLRTGEIAPHDPALRLTKITEAPYVPGATHPDWDQALTALEPEVAEWLQVRLGQAATGYPPDDDVLPIGQGGGSNGKSTLLAGLFAALGEHVTQVPERLIRASPNDHPTELTTLRGARLAVIDETPEVADLNVPRLKAMLGTEFITARQIRKDNVTWRATHSLLVMTNYRPRVNETDHGTWRRLALVRFTKKFPRDSRFRAAVARGDGGRREAALAWVVDGARRWYAEGRAMPAPPARVDADTAAWRMESDHVLAFVSDRLVPEPGSHILTSQVLDELNTWLTDRGHRPWSSQLLTSRFEGHGIQKVRPSRKVSVSWFVGEPIRGEPAGAAWIPAKPWLFQGYRWRQAGETE